MKKSDKKMLVIYIILGIVLMIIGVTIQTDYYLTWMTGMAGCFAGSFVAALFHADSLIVGILAGAAVVQYIIATIIYRYLCRRM